MVTKVDNSENMDSGGGGIERGQHTGEHCHVEGVRAILASRYAGGKLWCMVSDSRRGENARSGESLANPGPSESGPSTALDNGMLGPGLRCRRKHEVEALGA